MPDMLATAAFCRETTYRVAGDFLPMKIQRMIVENVVVNLDNLVKRLFMSAFYFGYRPL